MDKFAINTMIHCRVAAADLSTTSSDLGITETLCTREDVNCLSSSIVRFTILIDIN